MLSLFWTSLFICLLLSPLAAKDVTETDSIFMGMALMVEIEGQEYPHLRYHKGKHYVDYNGEIITVTPPVEFTFKKTIRHSENFIQLFDFEATPFSHEAEEQRSRYAASASLQNFQEERLGDALNIQVQQQGTFSGEQGLDYQMMSGQMQNSMSTSISASNLAAANSMMDFQTDELEILTHGNSFDTLIVDLKLKPDQDMRNCYLFVRSSYLYPPGEGELHYKVHFKEIGDLEGGKVKRVQFPMTGYPPGPEITETSYHLYTEDREIPTDYSEQRILLSEDEAYDFLYADLFTKEEPPDSDPVLFKPIPADAEFAFLDSVPPGKVQVSYKVHADGSTELVDVFPLPEEDAVKLESSLAQARFLPAIKGGLPEDREVTLSLREILLF